MVPPESKQGQRECRSEFMRVTNELTNQLATLRRSSLLPPFTRACLRCMNLACKALGRDHIASPVPTPAQWFVIYFSNQIPPCHTRSESSARNTAHGHSRRSSTARGTMISFRTHKASIHRINLQTAPQCSAAAGLGIFLRNTNVTSQC